MAVEKYSWQRVVLHWLLALLTLLMLAGGLLGLAPTSDADPGKIGIIRGHLIGGAVTLAVLLLYFLAAWRTASPAKAPTGNMLLDLLATVVKGALPLLVLLLALSGIATVRLSGLGDVVFGNAPGGIPEIIRTLPSFQAQATIARLLLVLVGLHFLGSLFHQLVLRDGLLRRMTFGRKD